MLFLKKKVLFLTHNCYHHPYYIIRLYSKPHYISVPAKNTLCFDKRRLEGFEEIGVHFSHKRRSYLCWVSYSTSLSEVEIFLYFLCAALS